MDKRVALFIPCFVDQMQPQVGLDTVKVLRRLSFQVEYPEDQTCCGQPAFNTGQWDSARPCAEHFVNVFKAFSQIVCPSGSCTSMVRTHYPELLKQSVLHEEAVAVGSRTFELSEFLVRVAGVSDVGAEFRHSVTYHPSCHATRELGIYDEPISLLQKVKGLDLRLMPNANECCGFGGMFSTKFGMVSSAMAETKIANIEATQAEYVTAVDPSCLMHLDGVLRFQKHTPKVIHLASILASEASL
ncbi:MAG TPA: (Fe-S)-binding protein [Candidatus Koribacter sp.]|jgi:L-lactate dehydrogenase complex protein LldE